MFSIRRVIAIPLAAAAVAGSALAVGGTFYHATPNTLYHAAQPAAAPSVYYHATLDVLYHATQPPSAAPNYFMHG